MRTARFGGCYWFGEGGGGGIKKIKKILGCVCVIWRGVPLGYTTLTQVHTGHRHQRKTHRHFPPTRLCTTDKTLWFHAGSHYSHLHGKKQPHLIEAHEKMNEINRFVAFVIILSIIIFNKIHNGYYPLFNFYLNSLFTVNYN